MRFVRFASDDGSPHSGILDDENTVWSVEGDLYSNPSRGARVGQQNDLTMLPPCAPSKILCVGRNYKANLASQGLDIPTEPVMFLKGPNTVIGANDTIIRPRGIEQFLFEGELAAIIGKTAEKVSARDASNYVFGYTCANDMTAHDWRLIDMHWTRAKSSDTLLPVGPWIETEVDPSDLRLTTKINGDLRQDGRTSDMVFSVPDIIEYVTRSMTLWPGDVVITGSPPGNGPVDDGDIIQIELEGIGELSNSVRTADA